MKHKQKYLLLKALIYRFFRLFIVFCSGFIMTGTPFVALHIALLDMFFGTIFYYYFDTFWFKIVKIVEKIIIRVKYRKL